MKCNDFRILSSFCSGRCPVRHVQHTQQTSESILPMKEQPKGFS